MINTGELMKNLPPLALAGDQTAECAVGDTVVASLHMISLARGGVAYELSKEWIPIIFSAPLGVPAPPPLES